MSRLGARGFSKVVRINNPLLLLALLPVILIALAGVVAVFLGGSIFAPLLLPLRRSRQRDALRSETAAAPSHAISPQGDIEAEFHRL